MRYLLLILSFTLYAAEEAKLPAEAQTAIDKADKAILTVQSKADAEIAKLRQGLITTLTKAQEAVTKKGDLTTALAIKAKIEAEQKLMPDLLGDAVAKGKVLCADLVVSEAFTVADLVIGGSRLSGSGNKAVASIKIPKGDGITFKYTMGAQNFIVPFTVRSKSGGYIYIGSYRAILPENIKGKCKMTPAEQDITIQGMNNVMRLTLAPDELVTIQVHEPTIIAEGISCP